LSQAAIEVLAVVAYHQPATAEEVDRLRNHHSSAILNQLVRRDLLAVHRDPHDKRTRRYTTTDRVLSLFGLDAIADLPQAEFEEDLELP
jgi:segregation and condensation protein B